MIADWAYIGIFTLLSLFLPAVAIALAAFLSPKKPNSIKNSTYECGVETVGETWIQFRAQYYVFALVFLVFDVETIFLYPWAVAYNQLTLFGVLEAILFVAILLGGLIYTWRKGALEWV
ncbi:MAG: NAD(P)H-quinone oxidoreductase subunit 3 [Chloroflexi bacterium]|nr:NAD(P)H-quinone oxidoreductase subunit 3 [Chloroflexota bacterium]